MGDPKALFSIAITLRCKGGQYSLSWIDPLYPWSIPLGKEESFFESLVWFDLVLNPGLPDHSRTLYPFYQWARLYIYIAVLVDLYVCVCVCVRARAGGRTKDLYGNLVKYIKKWRVKIKIVIYIFILLFAVFCSCFFCVCVCVLQSFSPPFYFYLDLTLRSSVLSSWPFNDYGSYSMISLLPTPHRISFFLHCFFGGLFNSVTLISP